MPSRGIGSLASTFCSLASISCAISTSFSSRPRWGCLADRRDALVRAVPEEAADHLTHLVERLTSVEDRLVLRDVVLGCSHLDQIQRAQLHPAELLDLAVAREDARAVGAQLAVLHHDTELDREPEDPGEERDVVVVLQAIRRLASEPVKLGERERRQQVAVAEDLV